MSAILAPVFASRTCSDRATRSTSPHRSPAPSVRRTNSLFVVVCVRFSGYVVERETGFEPATNSLEGRGGSELIALFSASYLSVTTAGNPLGTAARICSCI